MQHKRSKFLTFCFCRITDIANAVDCQLGKSYLFKLVVIFLFSLRRRNTAEKMKFCFKFFFRKCDQIHKKLRIQSHFLKKSLVENFNFYAGKHQYSHFKLRQFLMFLLICSNKKREHNLCVTVDDSVKAKLSNSSGYTIFQLNYKSRNVWK